MRLLIAYSRQITPADLEHGSVVTERPSFPETDTDFADLETEIAADFNSTPDLLIMNVTILPETNLHPIADGKYRYCVTYTGAVRMGMKFGRARIDAALPVTSTGDIRIVEEHLRQQLGYTRLNLLGCWHIR